jgi:hypothetical protein
MISPASIEVRFTLWIDEDPEREASDSVSA